MHIDQASRSDLLITLLRARGIRDERLLQVIRAVPRELFVPADLVARAYDDVALPIAAGQILDAPHVVARMIEALEIHREDRVLEVGTGTGYGAALLGLRSAYVHTIERVPELARAAAARFHALGLDHVQLAVGDGSRGWAAHAPYDAILVNGCVPDVPPELVAQLAPGGRVIIPIGDRAAPRLVRIRRQPELFSREDLGAVPFGPLHGDGGYAAGELAAPVR